jgi:uncharacterized protein with NRDE domain
MCTATWIRTGGGYEVFFNRDELATRKPARAPAVRVRDGVRFLAPEDGDAGGTWIGVNERGVSVGLANGPEAAPAARSRGQLVLDLLAAGSVADVGRRVLAADPSRHRPFELFAIEPGGEVGIWSSDARTIERRPGVAEGAILVSSSRDAERARRERRSLLERLARANGGLDAKLLAAFHASHEPERGPYSPCMHREGASTVSLTRVRVGEGGIEMEYRAGPPCEAGRAVAMRL